MDTPSKANVKLTIADKVARTMDDHFKNLPNVRVSHPSRLETVLRVQTDLGPRYFTIRVSENF